MIRENLKTKSVIKHSATRANFIIVLIPSFGRRCVTSSRANSRQRRKTEKARSPSVIELQLVVIILFLMICRWIV